MKLSHQLLLQDYVICQLVKDRTSNQQSHT